MRYLRETLAATACIFVMSGNAALADQKNSSAASSSNTASASNTGSDKQVVQRAIDGEWLTVNGKVKSISGDNFILNYGKGQISVEMDGWAWGGTDELRAGDRVIVSGRMDNDFYEQRKIEASSVFVPRRSEYIYANPADEEGGYYSYSIGRIGGQIATAQDDEWIAFTGKVTRVDGDEITVDTGLRTVDVDISGTDQVAEMTVDVGDRVSVTGEMDDVDLFDDREVEADSVVILRSWDRSDR